MDSKFVIRLHVQRLWDTQWINYALVNVLCHCVGYMPKRRFKSQRRLQIHASCNVSNNHSSRPVVKSCLCWIQCKSNVDRKIRSYKMAFRPTGLACCRWNGFGQLIANSAPMNQAANNALNASRKNAAWLASLGKSTPGRVNADVVVARRTYCLRQF